MENAVATEFQDIETTDHITLEETSNQQEETTTQNEFNIPNILKNDIENISDRILWYAKTCQGNDCENVSSLPRRHFQNNTELHNKLNNDMEFIETIIQDAKKELNFIEENYVYEDIRMKIHTFLLQTLYFNNLINNVVIENLPMKEQIIINAYSDKLINLLTAKEAFNGFYSDYKSKLCLDCNNKNFDQTEKGQAKKALLKKSLEKQIERLLPFVQASEREAQNKAIKRIMEDLSSFVTA